MKQYKLLKDLPGVKAGHFFIQSQNTGYFYPAVTCGSGYPESFLKAHPDFFEEVKELEKLFTIRDLEKAAIYAKYSDSCTETEKIIEKLINDYFPQHIDQLKHLK